MASIRVVPSFIACLTLCAPVMGEAQDVVDGYASRTFAGAKGTRMPYRLFVPDERSRAKPLPVIVYLHGSGGIGTDNLKQISGGNTTGTRRWVTPAAQARHPSFVVAPQLPPGNRWDLRDADGLAPYAELVFDLLESLSR